MANSLERLVWTDIETFGLDVETDPIIEVGFKITDLSLNVLESFSTTIWDSIHDQRMKSLTDEIHEGNESASFVHDMHWKSGLFQEAGRQRNPVEIAERRMNKWLDHHEVVGKQDPLCGSSVSFDRSFFWEQYPSVAERFFRRNIDVSSVKELCARYNPEVFAKLDDFTLQKKEHRVDPDINDTLSEFKYYVENFLWVSAVL